MDCLLVETTRCPEISTSWTKRTKELRSSRAITLMLLYLSSEWLHLSLACLWCSTFLWHEKANLMTILHQFFKAAGFGFNLPVFFSLCRVTENLGKPWVWIQRMNQYDTLIFRRYVWSQREIKCSKWCPSCELSWSHFFVSCVELWNCFLYSPGTLWLFSFVTYGLIFCPFYLVIFFTCVSLW